MSTTASDRHMSRQTIMDRIRRCVQLHALLTSSANPAPREHWHTVGAGAVSESPIYCDVSAWTRYRRVVAIIRVMRKLRSYRGSSRTLRDSPSQDSEVFLVGRMEHWYSTGPLPSHCHGRERYVPETLSVYVPRPVAERRSLVHI